MTNNALWADRLCSLVQRNREHLTQWGDYRGLIAATPDKLRADFCAPPDGSVRMGIWTRESLIGLASLTRVAPGTFVLGYWIDAHHTGQGIVTASCRALMDCAQHTLGAVESWAGVRHANLGSLPSCAGWACLSMSGCRTEIVSGCDVMDGRGTRPTCVWLDGLVQNVPCDQGRDPDKEQDPDVPCADALVAHDFVRL